MENSPVQLFFDMLQACYGVWSWRYDENLQLQYTNCPSPELYRSIFLGRGRREAILAHGETSDAPMIISDTVGLMWGLMKEKEAVGQETGGSFYTIGPVLNMAFSTHMLNERLEPFQLPLFQKWELIQNIQRLPDISTVVLFQQIIALYYYLNKRKIRVSSFAYYTPLQEDSSHYKPTLSEEVPHVTTLTEQKLLDMVRTGNLEYHEALADAGSVSPGIRVRGADPIRQAKYSVVAFVTLCTRAAIEGGLSSEVAYTLSDTYTQSVDDAKTISQVAAVSHTMYEDFIRRVNQVRRKSGISRPVRICCDYIDIHPEEELSLTILAGRAGYTESYLARKFKAEVGMSINAYVRRARISRAKYLLSSTTLNIQEIADALHFCSQSYFAEAFQKETGATPSAFRAATVTESS